MLNETKYTCINWVYKVEKFRSSIFCRSFLIHLRTNSRPYAISSYKNIACRCRVVRKLQMNRTTAFRLGIRAQSFLEMCNIRWKAINKHVEEVGSMKSYATIWRRLMLIFKMLTGRTYKASGLDENETLLAAGQTSYSQSQSLESHQAVHELSLKTLMRDPLIPVSSMSSTKS